ncbi:MAG: VCBS repeat-containing protein [Microcoleus sp. Co-bin12]|nr:VCBS repeat-containing protein [Microcoleus sp. Co-bin12]
MTDATFSNATTLSMGTAPFSVAVGDFNGDGFSDLVTANQGCCFNKTLASRVGQHLHFVFL